MSCERISGNEHYDRKKKGKAKGADKPLKLLNRTLQDLKLHDIETMLNEAKYGDKYDSAMTISERDNRRLREIPHTKLERLDLKAQKKQLSLAPDAPSGNLF